MGIKLAKALGNKVVAISTSANKEKIAKEKGADIFVASKDPESVKAAGACCDIILNTVSAPHELMTYFPLLKKQGVHVCLGGVPNPHTFSQMPLMFNRQSVAGSLIGGIAETQEVIDLCHKHNIYPDCEIITAKDIDMAWEKLMDGSNPDGIRYVIDIKESMKDASFMPKQ